MHYQNDGLQDAKYWSSEARTLKVVKISAVQRNGVYEG